MALEKTSNLYAAFEQIIPALQGGNLTTKAAASAMVISVLNCAIDALATAGKDTSGMDWLMEDSPEAKTAVRAIRDEHMICITAANNQQNTYLQKAGLMQVNKTAKGNEPDFI